MPIRFSPALLLYHGLCIALACALVGCHAVLAPSDEALESLLTPIESAPESVTLEVFHVRIPVEMEDQVRGLWSRVDEQQIDNQTRSRLTANGLRAGTVGAPLPVELTELLELVDQPATQATGEKVITSLTAPGASPAASSSFPSTSKCRSPPARSARNCK